MTRTLIEGFANHISRDQVPKYHKPYEPKRWLPTYQAKSNDYTWNESLRASTRVDGSGEADETHGWFCPDCGAPVWFGDDENIPPYCVKCGSTRTAEYR